MEFLLENSIRIPGLHRAVGLDAVIGVVPVAGDVISAVLGLYLVWEARSLGMSRWKLARMVGNVGVDTVIGAIPFAGDVFDFLFRSNTRNLKMIRRHLDRHHPETRIIEA